MKNSLFQWNFVIDGLIPSQVQLKRKVWLRKGELLLEKKKGKLIAYLLGDDKDSFKNKEKIIPYLWMSCLISNNAPDLEGGGGVSISSKDELGTQPVVSSSISIALPEEAVREIEKYAHKFLGFIGKLHDKYIDIVTENEFLAISLEYFYDAEKKFVYSNEGFISAVISLEALFNEGPTDIAYKLSHRAGFLLGLTDIEPVGAFEKLKDFYNKRSKLVHGGKALQYDPDRYLVSRYTRRAIVIFLILLKNEQRRKQKNQERKINILKEIDCAMLHEGKRKDLKKEINKGLKDFKLSIPRTFEGTGKKGKYRVTAW
jgi:hypothetical protein